MNTTNYWSPKGSLISLFKLPGTDRNDLRLLLSILLHGSELRETVEFLLKTNAASGSESESHESILKTTGNARHNILINK